MLDQRGVFNAARAMADARWAQVFQAFPYAVRPARFPGVNGARNALLRGILEGGNMREDRIARLVSSQVNARYMPAPKAFNQFHRRQALLRRVMAQGAEDETRLDACFLADLRHRVIH